MTEKKTLINANVYIKNEYDFLQFSMKLNEKKVRVVHTCACLNYIQICG